MSSATSARGGRALDSYSGLMLAECCKEQLEQLPPPLFILDPPFAPGCIYPVGVVSCRVLYALLSVVSFSMQINQHFVLFAYLLYLVGGS